MPILRANRRLIMRRRVTAASPPVFTKSTSGSLSGAGTSTLSASSISIPTGRVYILVAGGLSGRDITNGSSSIGSAIVDASGTISLSSLNSHWWATAVSPGETGNITLAFTGTFFGTASYAIYYVSSGSLSSATPVIGSTDITSSTTSGSASVATLANGVLVGVLFTSNGGTTNKAITSSDETMTPLDFTDVGGCGAYAHANGVAANASFDVAWSWTTACDGSVVNYAFR